MRHMSFSLTTPQILARTKTVTRRLGWATLKPGTLLQAVEKSQGLRKGEKVNKLGVIRVVSVRRERLATICDQTSAAARAYGRAECRAEGFPDWPPAEFLQMFCKHNGCDGAEVVTRIEFEHVESDAKEPQA